MKFIATVLMTLFFFTGSAQTSLDSLLNAYYPFNGNSLDESGNKHHAVNIGATLTNDRNNVSSSAYSFDGSNDHMEVNRWDSLCPTDEVSISFWSKANQFKAQFQVGLSPESGALGRMAVSANYNHNGIPATFWDYANIVGGRMQLLNDPYVTTWEHYVFTASLSSDSMIMYRNGKFVKGQSMGPGLSNVSREFWIGGIENLDNNKIHYFNGILDEIRIYNRVIDTCEVKVLADGDTTSPFISQTSNILGATGGTAYQWYLNGLPIPGANSALYLALQTGNYYVKSPILDSCYIKKSNQILYINIGVEDFEKVDPISIQPNPFNTYTVVRLPFNESEFNIILRDEKGSVVLQKTLAEQEFYIDRGSMQSGLYILEVSSGDRILGVKKLMVQ